MTDADVDGAHIRTLLLTFFYRQMPELVERGHIYIAQPPLYKVTKGRNKQYLKDDHELNELLLTQALDDANLHLAADAPAITKEAFEALAREHGQIENLIKRLHRYDSRVLHALIEAPELTRATFRRRARATRMARRLPAPTGSLCRSGHSPARRNPAGRSRTHQCAHRTTRQPQPKHLRPQLCR